MVTSYPSRSTFKISFIVLSSQILLLTPMELNLQLRTTDGEPLQDPTCYHHIIGSFVTLVSLVLTFLMLFTFSVSLCISFPIVIIFVFFTICGEPSCIVFSFHALAHYTSRHILMQPRPVICLIVDLFLPIMFSLAPLSLPGRQRNKPLYPARALRLSWELWHRWQLR